MKNIKYFESVDDYSEWGIELQTIEEMFYDISDLGWLIRVNPSKRLVRQNSISDNIEFEFQYYIKVVIYKPFNSIDRDKIRQELNQLIKSTIFIETLEEVKLRLEFFDYEISDTDTNNGRNLEITITKKSD
jgi:hypothetical protein